MEILTPSSYFSNSNLFVEESWSPKWTAADNKAFENALAVFDEYTPHRWERVAEIVPGKTVWDVIRHYKELEDDVTSIEAGLVPVPGYNTSLPFTLEWGSGHGFDGFMQSYVVGGRKSSCSRPSDQERKKGVPWTEEEHKLFLMGLKKYGKGDWRNISRNFVITRTPTQVASHAQKYFIRQLSGGKDKRRASIHDITTVNLNDGQTFPRENKIKQSSPLAHQSNSAAATSKLHIQWNQTRNETITGFGSGNMFVSDPYNYMNSNEVGLQGRSPFGSRNMVFRMHPCFSYPSA
uniref:MYB-like transcription factor DVL1 n=1 Tax=Antirrhinum majus TaxID=4151 RepID=Q8S9H6_ANTMA|nr:MYB-like transcription factor DVL1 [Antirrhinum majus]